MINIDYIFGILYVPIFLIILLMVMTYFHRKHHLRYLYLTDIVCFFVSILCCIFLMRLTVGDPALRPWMIVIPFLWVGTILAGYALFAASVIAFIAEHARRHRWAKVVAVLIGILFIGLCLAVVYFLMQGIQSLKSG